MKAAVGSSESRQSIFLGWSRFWPLPSLAVTVVGLQTNRGATWAQRFSFRLRALSFPAKVAVAAMAIGATVHAAIVPTHCADERVIAGLFAANTLGSSAQLSGRWPMASLAALLARPAGGNGGRYVF